MQSADEDSLVVQGPPTMPWLDWIINTLRLPPRAADPAATVVPVLAGIALATEVRRVVEFGCGPHSTGTFLDREIFPAVEQVVSVEVNPAWAAMVADGVDDDRLVMRTPAAGALGVDPEEIAAADCILIDDGLTIEDRLLTIARIGPALRRPVPVLVHDFDRRVNQRAARAAFGSVTHLRWCHPSTGLAMVEPPGRPLLPARLSSDPGLPPTDGRGWSAYLRATGLAQPSSERA